MKKTLNKMYHIWEDCCLGC